MRAHASPRLPSLLVMTFARFVPNAIRYWTLKSENVDATTDLINIATLARHYGNRASDPAPAGSRAFASSNHNDIGAVGADVGSSFDASHFRPVLVL